MVLVGENDLWFPVPIQIGFRDPLAVFNWQLEHLLYIQTGPGAIADDGLMGSTNHKIRENVVVEISG